MSQPNNSSATLATYTYDASGQKLRNTGSDGSWDYIGGIVYNNPASNSGNGIVFIQTEAGRAVPTGTGIPNSSTVYHYEYNLTDHLGNTRVSFDKNPTGGKARNIQEDEYYAFGLRSPLYNYSNNNRYFYNGKEVQTDLTNQYDYGARFYDPIVGRWTTIDPLAEKMFTYSPYGYAFNNPIRFIDVGGQIPYPITIRAFAPFKEFGFGFHGDGRGYSTSSGVTSRSNERINFDTDKSSVSAHVSSSPTFRVSNPGGAKTATPSVEFDKDLSISQKGDAKTFSFGTHSAAANPKTPPGTPDIDIFSDFSITSNAKAGTLSISGKLTGDNFPSTEAFISDPSGHSVFLGVGQIGKGVDKDWGPLTGLPGTGENNPITSFNLTISTDKKGNFTGVQVGDNKYTLDQWKKQFTDKKPQQQ